MQDELEEIKQLFFEESDEGLDAMESGLLGLSEGDADLDIINDIFRAAHSIKGGAATFAFNQIAEFTHHAETLLDQMRDGSRPVTTDSVELLLKGVDSVREMMASAREGEDVASDATLAVRKQIEAMLEGESVEQAALANDIAQMLDDGESENSQAVKDGSNVQQWVIEFKPHRHFLQYGNKPELLFREIAELGDLEVVSRIENIPDFHQIQPDECYVSWTLTLSGEVSREAIVAVFDWVDDKCDLEIHSAGEETPEDETSAEVAVPAQGSEPPVSELTAIKKAKSPSPAAKASPKNSGAKAAGSIRVGIDKIDALLNLVGELVITQSILKNIGAEKDAGVSEKLDSGLSQLESNARELQEVAMKMRMLPINNTFSRFPRMVHDLSKQLDKKVELEIVGEQTELDKTVLEKVADPLVHLVRNALDHGIEMPEERIAAGKPETGTMTLSAAHEAGNIVISISDDGAGINPEKVLAKARDRGIVGEDEILTTEEINQLIFRAGFSTAEVVSDVSGRGVGMDVVRRNIQDLGGRVEVESEFGKGSTFKIRLPLTMAILDGQLVRVQDETYIVPLLNIVESVVIDMARVSAIGTAAAVYQLREQHIPVINLSDVLGVSKTRRRSPLEDLPSKILVIVDLGNEQVGLVVDELLDQQQVVIKSLETNYQQLDGLSGATILGDGEVALILDLTGLVNQCYRMSGPKTGVKEPQQDIAVA